MNKEIIRSVLQGKIHFGELPSHGIDAHYRNGTWVFGPPVDEPLVATKADLMRGVQTLISKPKDVQEWARFVLAASNLIELEELEDDILELIWELSNGDLEMAKRQLPEA